MMTIALHARWSGQPNRAAGLEGILTTVLSRPEAVFMRRDDIARYWLSRFLREGRARDNAPRI
jgi:hypothetical protein